MVEEAIEEARQFLDGLPERLDERMLATLVLALAAMGKKKLDEDTVINLLRAALYPKPRKRGGDAFAKSTRDIMIAGAIQHIHQKFGFNFTRNRATRSKESACSVVAAALGRLQVNLL
jgi:hypothetical protein